MFYALTEREVKILKLRFGLENEHPHTLQAIGNIFHVTKERIRRIEEQALGKIAKKIIENKRIKDEKKRTASRSGTQT